MAIIITNKQKITCLPECGEISDLWHSWWECKMLQELWKTVWPFLKELNIELLYDPIIHVYLYTPKLKAET